MSVVKVAIANANIVRATKIHKTNVLADLHELLSMAKNLPELSIRNQRSALANFNPLKIPLI